MNTHTTRTGHTARGVRTVVLAALLGLATLAGATACIPSSGVVTERREDRNQPGGQGPHHILIHICVSARGGQNGCDDFDPDEVKNCSQGSKWPDCKEAAK